MKVSMPLLQSGDQIRIVSSARKINPSELEECIKYIREKGFKPTLGDSLYRSSNQFAGSDSERLTDLQNAINDPEVKAIWMARGGYGTHRIIETLSIEVLKKDPKWIIGYSDVTVLHCALNSKNISSLHATMPINFEDQDRICFDSVFNILSGTRPVYKIPTHPLSIKGEASGTLLGGNLSIIYSLTGTNLLPNFTNAILFIEDLDEYLYHIDRMMMNLKLSGILDQIAGLVIGGMSDMNDNTIPFGKNAEEIIWEHTKDLKIPVCFGFPAGHQFNNQPLVFGEKIYLNVNDAEVSITY
jgi:muramoyltetrapeptide carboxypeptidase